MTEHFVNSNFVSDVRNNELQGSDNYRQICFSHQKYVEPLCPVLLICTNCPCVASRTLICCEVTICSGFSVASVRENTWSTQCLLHSPSRHHCYQCSRQARTRLALRPEYTRCPHNAGSRCLHCTAQQDLLAATQDKHIIIITHDKCPH